MEIIRTENLTYVYSTGTPYEKCAVDNVSISINKGEIIGVIGHTGSGKSTLVQHFNGLLNPTSGKVFYNNEDIYSDKKKLHEIKFKVGLVFQYPEYQLFEDTVEKDISFGPKNMGLDKKQIKEYAYEAARLSGVPTELMSKSPFELSGGQKRRVAIAGVIAMKPEVLILDEPTAGLDPKGRDDMFKMLDNYHRQTGSTIIMVMHSMEDAAKFADRLLVMNKAKVFCFDKPSEVFKRSDEISKIGLDVPQITRVMKKLKERGIDLGDDIYTTEKASERIFEYLNAKRSVEDA